MSLPTSDSFCSITSQLLAIELSLSVSNSHGYTAHQGEGQNESYGSNLTVNKNTGNTYPFYILIVPGV